VSERVRCVFWRTAIAGGIRFVDGIDFAIFWQQDVRFVAENILSEILQSGIQPLHVLRFSRFVPSVP
jgi:hypothetical protein